MSYYSVIVKIFFWKLLLIYCLNKIKNWQIWKKMFKLFKLKKNHKNFLFFKIGEQLEFPLKNRRLKTDI